MSIYPVKLSEWFPYGDENYKIIHKIFKYKRCLACRKRLKFRKVIGNHSIPWGHGDLWCSWKCYNSGKIAKPDKRYVRRLKRKKKYSWGDY